MNPIINSLAALQTIFQVILGTLQPWRNMLLNEKFMDTPIMKTNLENSALDKYML